MDTSEKLVFAAAITVGAFLVYNWMKTGSLVGGLSKSVLGDANPFKGAAKTIFGEGAVTGEWGEKLAETIHYGEGGNLLNTSVTDGSFSRLGLTTAEVQTLQRNFPMLVNDIIKHLTAIANLQENVADLPVACEDALHTIGWNFSKMPMWATRDRTIEELPDVIDRPDIGIYIDQNAGIYHL